jgi:hypothetical protein
MPFPDIATTEGAPEPTLPPLFGGYGFFHAERMEVCS